MAGRNRIQPHLENAGETVERISQNVFGKSPHGFSFPGGKTRGSFVVEMTGGEKYVYSRRETFDKAYLEAQVLRELGQYDLAPKMIALMDNWVVQEFVEGQRLSVVLSNTGTMAERRLIVASALTSLAKCHEVANEARLQLLTPELGTVERWSWNRTGAAKRISKDLGIDEPQIDRKWLAAKLAIERNDFTKWDARPGNAMVGERSVSWFDWEDCGRSCTLEDLAFVLCDEWTNLDEISQMELERQFLPSFNRLDSHDRAEEYYRLFCMVHVVLRLRMALKLRMRDGFWWDRAYCLAGDKVGVTAIEASRLIARGKRLSKELPQLYPYLEWFENVADRLEIQECHDGLPVRSVA